MRRCRNESLGEYLKRKNILQQDFAEKIGVTQAYVSLLLSGERLPSMDVALRIRELTGIDMLEIIFNKQHELAAMEGTNE